jgi:hypothetical protein
MNAIGRYFELVRRCPCGSWAVASWYVDEAKQPVRACHKCRHLLLTRLLEASLREQFGPDIADETIVSFLASNGCRIVTAIEEASRSQSPDVVVARFPLRPEQFVLVPTQWAERVLTSGVTG